MYGSSTPFVFEVCKKFANQHSYIYFLKIFMKKKNSCYIKTLNLWISLTLCLDVFIKIYILSGGVFRILNQIVSFLIHVYV